MRDDICGILLTRNQEPEITTSEPVVANDETKQQSDDGSKIDKLEDQVLRMYNDNGSTNLLSHGDTETTPFQQEFYKEASDKHIGFLPFFYFLVHMIRWTVPITDGNMLPVLSTKSFSVPRNT